MTIDEWKTRHAAARAAGKWLYASDRRGVRGRVTRISGRGVTVAYDSGLCLRHPDDLFTVRAR